MLVLYVNLLKLFTPDRAAIILLSAHFASTLPKDAPVQVEPWFKIRYTVEDIPDTLMQRWKSSTPSPVLHLPYKNKYITYVIIHMWSPLVVKSKENMALHVLLNYSLNQTLSTIAYEGGEAGLEYNLEYVESGLKICLSGFSQKLFAILDHILDSNTETSSAHFEAYRDAIRKLYFNEALKPRVLNTHLQFYLLRKDAFLLDDLLLAVRRLTVSDLLAYKQRFFANLRITAYVHGNLTAQDAIKFFDYTVKRTKCLPIERRKFSDVATLDAGTYQLRVMNCNPSDVNMCVARIHLLGQTDLTRDTYNQLLAVSSRLPHIRMLCSQFYSNICL
ncbi:unnamed protein product [Echinostoma caproni]|uniref:Peptidase_M16_M domain-containing protein n=1 Tax=Echinostoma caproni TaxID=27848 RepID=A0A183ANE6_9TREM|nr:unnamed protein product [Echinostoma caproni]